MNDQRTFNNIDTLLLQLALLNRELSQKKNTINQQIRVYSAAIADRTSHIETVRRNNKKLDEEIRVQKSIMIDKKARAKSMKTTNNLLRQYEQTLKEELESKKDSYNHYTEVYEEKNASYRKTFQSHKEQYFQNPLAQKLLVLQAEKEEIESRIKACEDEMTIKQRELDHVTAVNSSITEELQDSVSHQQPIEEPEEQLDLPTEEESDSSIDISCLHLSQTKILWCSHKTCIDDNAEEINEDNKVQDTTACSHSPEEASDGPGSCQQLDEQTWQDGKQAEEQNQETAPGDQVLSTVSDKDEVEEMERRVDTEEEEEPNKEDNKELTASPPSSSQDTNPQSSPATIKSSTPTFPFNFSPVCSPRRGTSDTKSPAFPFSLNSDPTTPVSFSGFGFDMGPSEDEDSSFAFTGSFFNKKTTESKSESSPEFPFGKQEQGEDFQFAFTSQTPQSSDKGNKDDFPFSFNF